MSPQSPVENVGDPSVGRLSIDKRFSGDLEATSKGEMLAAGTDVKGSAGYVAIERVTESASWSQRQLRACSTAAS